MPDARRGTVREDLKPLAEWWLMARLTLCVLDGPAEEGFLVGPLVTQDTALLDRWCRRSDELGRAGVVLLSATTLADVTPEADPRGRGGVVVTLPPTQ
jgi:hypothetical protein